MLVLRMLTLRRRRGRALKQKQRRTRRSARKTRVRKFRGGGNSNNENEDEYADILEDANDDTAPPEECNFMSNSKMRANISKFTNLFKTYYKDFFEEADKELKKEISELKDELEDPETSDDRKESIGREIEDLEAIIKDYSKDRLMKILHSHGESTIKGGARLDVLGEFNYHDRLPRLSEDIRVWRGLKDMDYDTKKYRQIHLETGRTIKKDKTRKVYGVDKVIDITGYRFSSDGVTSTSMDYNAALAFAEESIGDGVDFVMEFVIPAGTIALPINGEADPGGYDGGREIIILDPCEFTLKRLKCVKPQEGNRTIGIYEVDIEIGDFS